MQNTNRHCIVLASSPWVSEDVISPRQRQLEIPEGFSGPSLEISQKERGHNYCSLLIDGLFELVCQIVTIHLSYKFNNTFDTEWYIQSSFFPQNAFEFHRQANKASLTQSTYRLGRTAAPQFQKLFRQNAHYWTRSP